MTKNHPVVRALLTVLIAAGVTGCSSTSAPSSPASFPVPVPSSPSPSPSASPTVSPAGSPTVSPAGSPTVSTSPVSPAGADRAFPVEVTRTGGIAGVDDRVTIGADGSVVTTRRGKQPVRSTVPASTVDELRRLVAEPGFTRPSSGPGRCSDGYNYQIKTRSSTVAVQDCGGSHGPAVDRVLAIAVKLLTS
jgi:hypothetical protein